MLQQKSRENIKMKNIVIIILIAIVSTFAQAQDLNISQYAFYRDGMNPASFMQNNDVNVFVLYNNEFSGFEQQPNTQIADVSLNMNGHKIGLAVVNDIVGFDKAQNVKLRYARLFTLSENSFFSLGLSAGAKHNRLEATNMSFEIADDPLSYSDYAHTRLDFDFGAEFQFDKLFVGVSVTHLGNHPSNNEEYIPESYYYDYGHNPVAHYYGYAQYAINSNNAFRFYPNVLARVWKNTFWAEAGLIAFYKNKAWLGATYTGNHDLTFTTGMRVANSILFGYAFKSNMNGQILKPWGTNTHEVFLNFAFNKNKGNIKSVRFLD